MDDKIVTFKIDGPVIKDPYPLHEVIAILDDFHSMERELLKIIERETSGKCIMEVKEIHCMGTAFI